jgi:hypothetical protein
MLIISVKINNVKIEVEYTEPLTPSVVADLIQTTTLEATKATESGAMVYT